MATRTKLGLDMRYYYGNTALTGLGGIAGALVDLDFVAGTYYLNGKYSAASDVVTLTRTTAGWSRNSAGVLVAAATGELMRTDRGLYVAPARINTIQNNSWIGGVNGVVGSGGALPTRIASLNGSGITRTITYGTRYGMPSMKIRFSGTGSTDGNFDIRWEGMNVIPSGNNQPWALSCFMELTAGSVATTSAISLGMFQRDSGGTNLGSLAHATLKGALGSGPIRALLRTTTNQAGIVYVQPFWTVSYSNGAAIDFTIEFWGVQLEQGLFETEPILTANSGTVTRNADVVKFNADASIAAGPGSILVEYEEILASTGMGSRHLWSKYTDGNNYMRGYVGTDLKPTVGNTVSGTENVSIAAAAAINPGIHKLASRYATNGFAISADGAAVVTDTSNSLQSAGSSYIGGFGTGNQPGLYIRRFVAFPSIKTDAELMAMAA